MFPAALPAVGASASVKEQYTLTGSTGSPTTVSDSAADPANAGVQWQFNTDGSIDRNRTAQSSSAEFEYFSSFFPSPAADLWIRYTANAGDAPTAGDALNTWHALVGAGSANRTVEWNQTSVGSVSGSVKVELSTDSGGSTIVATGYYGGTATVSV